VKLLELKLTAFGPFSGQTLDLSAGNPGLHVVFGPNEAGKSSALRALHAALYGIPGQTSDAFLHPYEALRIGGRLRHSGGAEIAFIRRKANKNTLLAPDETRLDDHALDRFLGGESADKFEMFWGIDHARLVQGGRDILEGHGDLGESLFAAGSGVSHLRKLRSTLEDEASALYTPRGHQRAVNQGVGKLRELRTAQREATVSADEWARREQASRGAGETVTQLSKQELELARERSRIERVKRVLPMLAERNGLQERLAANTDAVLLPEDFPKRRQESETALRSATQNLERAENELREQKELVDRLGPTPPLVAESDAVNTLHIDLGKHRKALGDRPRLIGQRYEQRALANRLLAEWRPDLDLERAAALRVFVGRRTRIQKLAAERERLDERLASADRDGAKAGEQKEALQGEASQLPPTRDAERLVVAINEARRGGDAEDEREKAAQAVKRFTAQRDSGLEKVGLAAATADRLEELRAPSAAVIARFEAREKELRDVARATGTERQRLDKETRELGVKIETLHTKKAVPTEEDLASVRARRDAAFELLREHWEKDRDVTEKARELLGKGKLIELYPRAVKEADTVADRLRAQAEHVAKLAQYLEDRERLGKEMEDAEAAGRRQKESATEIESNWRALWKPVVTTPPSIEDARAWRTDFERLLERSQAFAEAREKLARLDAWIEKQVKSLRAAMTALDPNARPLAELAATLAAGERLRHRVEKENHARSEHARRTSETGQAAIDAEKAKRAAQADINEWQRKWTEATRGLLSGDATPPDDVLAALDAIEKVLRALDEAAGYDARIAGIDRDAEQFRGDVCALALRLGETVEQEYEDQWVDSVHKRLAVALQEEERRRQARERQSHLQADIARNEETVQAAELALATLRGEARCGPDADLAVLEQRSTQLRTCRKEIERVERDLVRSGDGASIAELEAEAAGVERDTMDVRLGEIRALLDEIEKSLVAARDARATAQAELGLLHGPSAASEKAEEIQATLAKLREDVVRYSRLRVASTLLARRIDDYRRRNQAPLLLRAGALFREMTLRSFERLEADTDGDRPILTGVRPDGKRVPAHGMSEGTRDQLFLALRLAAVEASCATSEPLPFIVDDVLVQFDDERSAAGLRVLADVASRTQVVLFTHHRQVRASAEAMNTPTQVIVHEL
jgi:uncharacterized protein YhaN